MPTKFLGKRPRNMEITDRNFVTLLHEIVTQNIDFHIQLTQNFVQELRLLGLILGVSYKYCHQIPAFGMVAAFFSEMYQLTFRLVLFHSIPTGRIDWLMRGVIERCFSETTSVSFLGYEE